VAWPKPGREEAPSIGLPIRDSSPCSDRLSSPCLFYPSPFLGFYHFRAGGALRKSFQWLAPLGAAGGVFVHFFQADAFSPLTFLFPALFAHPAYSVPIREAVPPFFFLLKSYFSFVKGLLFLTRESGFERNETVCSNLCPLLKFPLAKSWSIFLS